MAWTLFGRNWLTGIICMWSGLIVDIPNGWALCDGNNGTPNLMQKFIRGTFPGLNPGREGGSEAHQHAIGGKTGFGDAAHAHTVAGNTGAPSSNSSNYTPIGGAFSSYAAHYHSLSFSTNDGGQYHKHSLPAFTEWQGVLPPYYELAYIIKV